MLVQLDAGGCDGFCVFRYVYNYLGGKHENVVEELVATLCTYGVTILWLGPCEVVLFWAFFNCFGLNFELWTAKAFSMEPFASFEVCCCSFILYFCLFVFRYEGVDVFFLSFFLTGCYVRSNVPPHKSNLQHVQLLVHCAVQPYGSEQFGFCQVGHQATASER